MYIFVDYQHFVHMSSIYENCPGSSKYLASYFIIFSVEKSENKQQFETSWGVQTE